MLADAIFIDNPLNVKHIFSIIDTLLKLFKKFRFEEGLKLDTIPPQKIDHIRKYICEFFGFVEFLTTYKDEFNTHVVKQGTVDDIIQRLYVLYKPHLANLLLGPEVIFNQNPETAHSETRTFLSHTRERDQLY